LTAWTGALLLACANGLWGASIPGLFSTGVDDSGALLGEEQLDPHYQITISPDPAFPGPDAMTLLPGFPVGPWVEEGPSSRWIAPQAAQGTGNEPGIYTYSTSFDLTGLDPATAQITGLIGTDDGLAGVRLNGVPLVGITSAGFQTLTEFTIPVGSPFADGVNTLEFDISNGGTALNPTGLRVEMTGRATGPGEAPEILEPPLASTVVVGDRTSFTVDAVGTPPLTYEWRLNNAAIQGATGATYSLEDVTLEDAGDYSVLVANASGSVTSIVAALTVLVPFPGIYNTGVDDNRDVLPDGELDPHYRLIVNAEFPGSQDAYVQSLIPSPPWVANSDRSRWIGPFTDPNGGAGQYVYELLLDLTGYEPLTAFLAGNWATDDGGSLFLNGADTGFRSPGFSSFSFFNLTNGFVAGTNRLEFRLENSGINPTGLRVENLRGTADEGTTTESAPRIVTQPRDSTNVMATEVSFVVVADGTQPFEYQWFRNDAAVTGATNSSLTLTQVTAAVAGNYRVRVSNRLGETNSAPARLTVIEPLLGVFNTGVDATGAALPTGEPDPHYLLLSGPDSAFPGPALFATAGPIPPWLENDEDSAWIAPRPDGSANLAPGSYRYRLIFRIDNPDEVETAAITANVGTDDGNGGIFLNGVAVSFGGSGFGAFTPLDIPAGSGFVEGLNTLDFVVNNGGADINPSGLRVDDSVLSGVTVIQQPTLSVTLSGLMLRIAWPVTATGFRLQQTSALPGGWTDSALTVTVEGNENVATVTPDAGALFLRLAQ
jgi:hypothetical protein